MIYPYFSNSYEFLRALLLQQIGLQRQAKANFWAGFDSIEVVVPDEAVKDDLSRALADSAGIASGIRFTTTQTWLDRMNHGSPDISARARSLEWAIYAVLCDEAFLERAQCVRLKRYLENNSSSALWPLVTRIAALFTTYGTYRADWLWNWAGVSVPSADAVRTAREAKVLSAHPDFAWEQALWKELCTRTNPDGGKLWPDSEAFLSIPQRWLESMHNVDKPEFKASPLYVFAPRELPPLALPQLLAQSLRRDVHLFIENPSSAFWFDPTVKGEDGFAWFHRNASARRALVDRVRQFVTQDTAVGDAVLMEDDMPQTSREAPANKTVGLEALANMVQLKARSEEPQDIYVRPREDTLLGALQTAVLQDDPDYLPETLSDADNSFLIVRAPNAVREVQALCDWIAGTIEASKESGRLLTASDFLVVTPDIDAMAGVISAVMGSRSEDERLSYHIAGQSELDVNSAARAMLAAMRFAGGAAAASEFFELIEMPAFASIRPQAQIDANRIAAWLAAAGYRWGLTQEHAQRAIERHLAQSEGEGPFEGTLERALERLVAGNLAGKTDARVAGDVFAVVGTEISGFETTDSDPDSFEFLLSLAQAFLDAGEMPVKQSPQDWLETTRRFADTLFAGYSRSTEMIAFVMHAASLAQTASEEIGQAEISFDTWCGALEKTLRSSKTTVRATGRITFAGTGDFAGMPFKCVAVIGLNDGESFPGSSRREEFDLTAARVLENGVELNAARRGDRDSRESNRGIFLDLLLAARRHFYVSYSIGSGSVPANPSVVLQDLKQALAERLADPAEIDRKITKTVPALAASVESFAPDMGLVRSRSPALAKAVNEAVDARFIQSETPFVDCPISVQKGAVLSVEDLARFFRYPLDRVFKILGIAGESDDSVETTPIARFSDADHLYKSTVRRRIHAAISSGKRADEVAEAAKYDPALGEQSVRDLLVQSTIGSVELLYKTLETAIGECSESGELLEGGKLEFAGLKGAPFEALAVPAHRIEEGKDGDLIVRMIGVPSGDPLKSFLLFAAVNVLEYRRGRTPVDFVFAQLVKEEPVIARWHVDFEKTNKEDDGKTPEFLESVLVKLLSIVNAHVSGYVQLAGPYEDADSPVWRASENFGEVQADSGEIVDSLDALAGFFNTMPPKKKSRSKANQTPPRERFAAAVEAFATVTGNDGGQA